MSGKGHGFQVTELHSEIRTDLSGRFKATMASKAMKMASGRNVHMNIRVIEFMEFKFVVKFNL